MSGGEAYLGFRVFVQELGYVCHDRPFIRLVDIHIFGVQQPGDAECVFCDVERMFQTLSIGLPLHLCEVDEVRLDGVDDGEERDTIAP